jgi:hypothetical protein
MRGGVELKSYAPRKVPLHSAQPNILSTPFELSGGNFGSVAENLHLAANTFVCPMIQSAYYLCDLCIIYIDYIECTVPKIRFMCSQK